MAVEGPLSSRCLAIVSGTPLMLCTITSFQEAQHSITLALQIFSTGLIGRSQSSPC